MRTNRQKPPAPTLLDLICKIIATVFVALLYTAAMLSVIVVLLIVFDLPVVVMLALGAIAAAILASHVIELERRMNKTPRQRRKKEQPPVKGDEKWP